MNINRAIGRIVTIFLVAYSLLFVRQLYVGLVEGPRLAQNPHNPRAALLAPYRGEIVARDGSVLARSTARGRVYPLGAAAAHAVGYASARYGTSGIEAAFDSELAPHPVANDPFAEIGRLIHGGSAVPAVRGATVVTTIDPAVQRTLYDALSNYSRAAGVVLDPRTGEVLALASVPSFDPSELDADFARISANPQSPLLDRATDGLYPPGSTFKIVIAAAALDAGVVRRPVRKISRAPSRSRATSISRRSRCVSVAIACSTNSRAGGSAIRSILRCRWPAIACPERTS